MSFEKSKYQNLLLGIFETKMYQVFIKSIGNDLFCAIKFSSLGNQAILTESTIKGLLRSKKKMRTRTKRVENSKNKNNNEKRSLRKK